MEENDQNIMSNDKAKILLFILTLIMAIRISSYFSFVPDAAGLTRIIKIGLRISTSVISLFLLWIFVSKKREFRFQYVMILPFFFYLAYLLWGILSIYWTTNVSFSLLQLSMTIETLIFSFFFFKLIRLYDKSCGKEITSFIFILNRSVFLMTIIFLIGALLNPEFFYRTTHGGNVYRLGGLIINPNELGLLSIVGITLSYVEIYFNKNKKYNTLAILTCLAVLLMTQSRSSLIGFVIITGIFLLIIKNHYLKIAAVAIAILTLPLVINTIILKEGDVEEVTSLTGRTEFWSDLIHEAFPLSPIYGFGFMSISTNTFYNKFISTHSYAASMAHNTFVEVLINLGLVGAFICLLQMLLTFFAIAVSKERVLQLMAFFMLVPLLINSITEFGIFGHTNYAIMFYQFVFLFFTVTVVNRKEVKQGQQSFNK